MTQAKARSFADCIASIHPAYQSKEQVLLLANAYEFSPRSIVLNLSGAVLRNLDHSICTLDRETASRQRKSDVAFQIRAILTHATSKHVLAVEGRHQIILY